MNDPGNSIPGGSDHTPHIATGAWISVVRAYNICTAAITKRIEPTGLNLLQHEILVNLMLQPGQSQQQLAARCFSAKSGISALVSEFERNGFITREADDTDARKKRLFLSKSGLAQAQENFAFQNEIIGTMASVYTPETLSDLEEGMNAASEKLKATYL